MTLLPENLLRPINDPCHICRAGSRRHVQSLDTLAEVARRDGENLNRLIHPQKTVPEHLKTVEATVAMIRAREKGRANAQNSALAALNG